MVEMGLFLFSVISILKNTGCTVSYLCVPRIVLLLLVVLAFAATGGSRPAVAHRVPARLGRMGGGAVSHLEEGVEPHNGRTPRLRRNGHPPLLAPQHTHQLGLRKE